jgi:hypothetical protein
MANYKKVKDIRDKLELATNEQSNIQDVPGALLPSGLDEKVLKDIKKDSEYSKLKYKHLGTSKLQNAIDDEYSVSMQ